VPVYSAAFAGTHCVYPRRDGQAELTWVASYIPRWFTHPQTVTHPSTNRARCRVTSLITTDVLTTTPHRHHQVDRKNTKYPLITFYKQLIMCPVIEITETWPQYPETTQQRIIYKCFILPVEAVLTSGLIGLCGFSRVTRRGEEVDNDD